MGQTPGIGLKDGRGHPPSMDGSSATPGDRQQKPLRPFFRTLRESLVNHAATLYGFVDQRPRLNVFTIHRIGEDQGALHPGLIEHQLRQLRKTHDFILPARIPSCLQAGKSLSGLRHQAILTIDDGHRCTYDQLFPICRRLGIPFAIFPPIDFICHDQWLWFDRLDYIYRHSTHEPPPYANILMKLRYLPPAERTEALEALEAETACTTPSQPVGRYRPITKEQIDIMTASGLVEFGGHTMSHTILTLLDDGPLDEELRVSKDVLESLTQRPVSCFCYPNGWEGDFDQRTERALIRNGYGSALTSLEGSNVLSSLKPFKILRIHMGIPFCSLQKEASGLGRVQKMLLSGTQ